MAGGVAGRWANARRWLGESILPTHGEPFSSLMALWRLALWCTYCIHTDSRKMNIQLHTTILLLFRGRVPAEFMIDGLCQLCCDTQMGIGVSLIHTASYRTTAHTVALTMWSSAQVDASNKCHPRQIQESARTSCWVSAFVFLAASLIRPPQLSSKMKMRYSWAQSKNLSIWA